MTKWLKVFRVGTPHPAFEFTEQVVREIAATYSYDRHPAPHSPGHLPSPGTPALAWTPQVRFNEGFLEALFDPAFLTQAGYAAIQSGNFRTLSPAFYAPHEPYNPTSGKDKWYFRHLAWLGAESPAGKGLDFIDKSLVEGFTPPQAWNMNARLGFSENERPGKTFVIFSELPPELPSLKIAVRQTPWNEAEAKTRIKQSFGLDGLREYSLVTDWSKDYLDESRYNFLAADMVFNEPQIVPSAIGAALSAIPGLPLSKVWVEEDRDRALSRARMLQEKINEEQPTGFSEPNGGIHVDRKKLLDLIQVKGKGIVPDDKLVAFAEQVASGIFADSPNFAELSESSALLFAERIINAELRIAKAEAKAAETEAASQKRNAEFAETQRVAAITTHVDRLILEGRIPAAKKPDFIAFAQSLKDKDGADIPFTFSENNQQITKPFYEVFFTQIIPTLVKEKAFVPPSTTLANDGCDPSFVEHDKVSDRMAASVNPAKE